MHACRSPSQRPDHATHTQIREPQMCAWQMSDKHTPRTLDNHTRHQLPRPTHAIPRHTPHTTHVGFTQMARVPEPPMPSLLPLHPRLELRMSPTRLHDMHTRNHAHQQHTRLTHAQHQGQVRTQKAAHRRTLPLSRVVRRMFPVIHTDQAHHIPRLNNTTSGLRFLIPVVPRMPQVPQRQLPRQGLLRAVVAALPIFAPLIQDLFR